MGRNLLVAAMAFSFRATTPVFAAQSSPPAAAEIFAPGVISDSQWQWRITFAADSRTAYYTTSPGWFPATRKATIMVSERRDDGTWSAPTTAPFSGTYPDIDPFITPDGRRLYFSSIRPVGGVARGDLDIWYVDRTPSGWSEPVHAGAEVNSPLDELYPSASAAGTLYFGAGPLRPGPEADWNIYRAEPADGGFAPRQALTAVNTDVPFDRANPTGDWEFNPEISADGQTLLFASLRPGGYGFGDLYVSHSRQGEWTAPRNLGPAVNTANDEFHPTLARDGSALFFARALSAPASRPSDFYWISTATVGALHRPDGR